jgi:hypothetical protein
MESVQTLSILFLPTLLIEMKRVKDNPDDDDDDTSLGRLLVQPRDRNLRRLILSYAYRSAHSLILTCKELKDLLLGDKLFWRYGVERELRKRMGGWPVSIIELYCTRVDPFFDAWPAKEIMPGRPQAMEFCSSLAWIWRSAATRVFFNYPTYSFSIMLWYHPHHVPGKRISSWLRFELNTTTQDWEIWYEWMFCDMASDIDGREVPIKWRCLPGSLAHCYITPNQVKTMLYPMSGYVAEKAQLLWVHAIPTISGGSFTGYITGSWMSVPGCGK